MPIQKSIWSFEEIKIPADLSDPTKRQIMQRLAYGLEIL